MINNLICRFIYQKVSLNGNSKTHVINVYEPIDFDHPLFYVIFVASTNRKRIKDTVLDITIILQLCYGFLIELWDIRGN